MGRSRSSAWNHFESRADGCEAVCKLCSIVIKLHASKATSPLWSHLRTKHNISSNENDESTAAPPIKKAKSEMSVKDYFRGHVQVQEWRLGA